MRVRIFVSFAQIPRGELPPLPYRAERLSVRLPGFEFKRILKMDRLRLRGITGARDEFLLAAIAQNLRRIESVLVRLIRDCRAARGKVSCPLIAALDGCPL